MSTKRAYGSEVLSCWCCGSRPGFGLVTSACGTPRAEIVWISSTCKTRAGLRISSTCRVWARARLSVWISSTCTRGWARAIVSAVRVRVRLSGQG